jgi:hypothetical protein
MVHCLLSTVFYSVLTSAETAMGIMLDKRNTSPQALQYLSNTYLCINENLQKDEKPTDGTIAAVMSLAIHEDLQGNPDRSKLHVDALERLIELRGGLTQLDNIQLQRKICMLVTKIYIGLRYR